MTGLTIEQSIKATNRIFEEEVVAKRNFGALDHVYTKDARIMPPGAEMIEGRENIRAFWPRAIEALGVKSILLHAVELQTAGEFAFEIGRAELGKGDDNTPVFAKFVVIWKREDGAWKWHVDIWNAVS